MRSYWSRPCAIAIFRSSTSPGAEALAIPPPFARVGRIEAGHYDPIRQLPSTDKRVIQIDTLVIGNGCARESATQGVITILAYVFPDFVRVNRERANLTGLRLASAAAQLLQRRRTRSGRRIRALDHRHHADGALATARLRHLAPVRRPGRVAPFPPLAHRRADASTSKARFRACSSRGSRWPRLRRWRRKIGTATRMAARSMHSPRELGLLARAVPPAFLVDHGPDGSGNGLPLSGVTYCGPRARAQDLPSPARCVRSLVIAASTGLHAIRMRVKGANAASNRGTCGTGHHREHSK